MMCFRLFSVVFVFCLACSLAVPPALAAYDPLLPKFMIKELTRAAKSGNEILMDVARTQMQLHPDLARLIARETLMQSLEAQVAAHPEMAEQLIAQAQALAEQRGWVLSKARLDVVMDIVAAAKAHAAALAITASKISLATPSALQLGALGAVGAGVTGAGVIGQSGAADSGGDSEGFVETPETEAEYDAQYGLGDINAKSAYERGGTGTDIVVGVFDSGIDTDHIEFIGQIAEGGKNFFPTDDQGQDDCSDQDGHGTHVSGIIAAARNSVGMHGVAYNAKILPLRALVEPYGDLAAVGYAVEQGVEIINNSWQIVSASDTIIDVGGSWELLHDAFDDAVNADIVVVFAAGNVLSGQEALKDNPSAAALLPYVRPANDDGLVYDDGTGSLDFSDLENHWISVVAVDTDGLIADFSHRCGVASDFCIAAPGVSIYSAYNDGGYAYGSGTSMAAPHVSGAVAVLMHLFPTLTPEQIVDLIFSSADKTGAFGSSPEIYGQGMLDLNAATTPAGESFIPTGDGDGIPVGDNGFTPGPAFGDGMIGVFAGRHILVLDALKRNFATELDSFVALHRTGYDLDGALDLFAKPDRRVQRHIGDLSLSFTKGREARSADLPEDENAPNVLTSLSLVMEDKSGARTTLDWAADPALRIGGLAAGWVPEKARTDARILANPYFRFGGNEVTMTVASKTGKDAYLLAGAFFGSTEGDSDSSNFGTLIEYRKDSLALQAGALIERNRLLGASGEGVFDTSQGAVTMFTGLEGKHDLSDRNQLVFNLHAGLTQANPVADGLMDSMDSMLTTSFGLGYVRQDAFLKNDSLLVSLNQPLRVESASAHFRVPTERTRDDTILYSGFTGDLAPSGREIDLSMGWTCSPDDDTAMGLGAMLRLQPDHVADAASDVVGMMRFERKF